MLLNFHVTMLSMMLIYVMVEFDKVEENRKWEV